MSGDYSRDRFDPRRHFSGLLQQQGRVHFDADANEATRILDRRSRAQTIDTLGPCVVPRETEDGFKIGFDGGKLTIGRGRIYVDGLLAENHGTVASPEFEPRLAEVRGSDSVLYDKQPYLLETETHAKPPDGVGPHLVYVVVYEREVTHLQMPELVDSAIGLDTVTALQTVWQVRFLPDVGDINCATPDAQIPGWTQETQPSAGRLSTTTVDVPDDQDPCVLPAEGGYRGPDDELYRIEFHNGGTRGTATFKWARANASVATRVTNVNGRELTVDRTGRDAVLRFNPGDWVEIIDDVLEFAGQPGEMRKVTRVVGDRIIEIDAPLAWADLAKHPNARVRRWDQRHTVKTSDGAVLVDLDGPNSKGVIPMPAPGLAVVLERGIHVTFEFEPSTGRVRSGDYWTFAARTADASVDPLEKAPPRGTHRHYGRLAVVTLPNTVKHDCRVKWPPKAPEPDVPAVIRIKAVKLAAGGPLGNDTHIPVSDFVRGINIECTDALDPRSVFGKPTCTVTLEMPFPFNDADRNLWTEPVVGFQPLILHATVEAMENEIRWKPVQATVDFLVRRLFQNMGNLNRGRRILAHLLLKGRFIWGRELRDGALVYLDGETFGVPGNQTDVRFLSGDGQPGGDFEMWFYLEA